MSMLAFFPWLRLKREVAVGAARLMRYDRGRRPGGALQTPCDLILEPYVFSKTHPVQQATIVQWNGHELLDDLSEDEVAAAFDFAELVAVAGLAARRLFSHHYWNRDDFRFTIQRFDDPGRGSFLQVRRVDGSQWVYINHVHHIVSKPPHVSGSQDVEVDEALLEALVKASHRSEWPRFREAVQSYNLANTDNAETPIEAAVVLINGALERILDAQSGNENDFAVRLVNAFTPIKPTAPNSCDRLLHEAAARRCGRYEFVREAWARDIFRTRGDLAHGSLAARYPGAWSAREHLLLASFLFPLLLKVELVRLGDYELTTDDHDGLDAFEALCCADHFRSEGSHPSDFPWHKTLRRAGIQRLAEKWLADLSLGATGEDDVSDAEGGGV